MKFQLRNILLPLLAAVCFAACQDELPYDFAEIGDGEATISATVSFQALEPALESRASGTAVNSINELWMVIYKVDATGGSEELYEKFRVYRSADDYYLPESGFQLTNATTSPSDATTVNPPSGSNVGSNDGQIGSSGESTPRARFRIPRLPYGRYKMYAVANVDLTDVDCETSTALRSTRFDWNTNVALDNQMFGYVTLSTTPTSTGFDAPVLTINKPDVSLHSWIKRLVSKVTVAFDGSELYENVHVYIKSVTIHDIPRSCPLGMLNKPESDADLIANGESFTYYDEGQGDNAYHEDWHLEVTKGSGVLGASGHTGTDPALYFYENMQGNYEGVNQFDKRQDPDAVGTPIDSPADGPDYKDAKLYGTYIEVEAYYDSRDKDKISKGPIKYRFMLGKNSTFDYDAERNYHYKLTLKFRGWANEADWHISYREYTPTLITPEPYYISYLYDQEMEFPARVKTGDETVFDYVVKAEIVENNWWPYDPTTRQRPPQYIGATTDVDGFAWNVPAFNSVYPYVPYVKGNPQPYGGSNYVGFLALRPNESDVIGADYNYGAAANTFLKNYYQEHNLAVNEYSLNGAGTSYDPIDKSVSLRIPMYTRNREMVPASDFTANNPFNAYYRFAKVRFTLWKNGEQVEFTDENGNKETERIATIYQVPRIENPKAIYRAHDNDRPFEIQLMTLPNAGTKTYAPFISDGPWRASIMCQSEQFIQLTGNDGKTITRTGDYVQGSTGEIIKFTYKPAGTIAANKARYGVIKVEYHDYNCVHLIFVRQGYHIGVDMGDAKWSCYNVYATASASDSNTPSDDTNVNVVLTQSPLSCGSFLKRNQYNYSIRQSNNDSYGWLAPVTTLSTARVTSTTGTVTNRNARWDNIQGYAWTNYGGTAGRVDRKWADTWTAVGFQAGQRFDVPTAQNFIALRDAAKFSYGIVYADGAETTATQFDDANGYTDYDNTGTQSAKGIRACVAYYESDGRNIIFPLSAIGQARRARQIGSPASSGSISYSGVTTLLSQDFNMYRPLTYDVYRTPGALYWIKQPIVTSEPSNITGLNKPDYASWDINYLTLVFNPYSYTSLGNYNGTNYTSITSSPTQAATSSDALPIKLIYKN